MKFYILFFLLFSSQIYADGLSTFTKYKESYSLLENDIIRMQQVVIKNNSPLYKTVLNDLETLKKHFNHLENPLTLQKFYLDAKDNGWKKIEIMTLALTEHCEDLKNKNFALCKTNIEEMKNFVMNSNLNADNKDSIMTFLDDYLTQIYALSILNSEFINAFNSNVDLVNQKIQVEAAQVPKIVVKLKPVSNLVVDYNNKIYLLYLLMFAGIVFLIKSYVGYKNNKYIKDFYQKVYKLGRKNNLELRIFGKISTHNKKILLTIQNSLLDTLSFSRALSRKTNIMFKNNNNAMLIEVKFQSTKAIQTVLAIPNEKVLKESLEKMQGLVEKLGGECSYTTHFNSAGEVFQNDLLLIIPK